MRVLIQFFIENSRGVQRVNTDFSECVNNFIMIQQNPDVNNFTFGIFKKSQIAGLTFLHKTQNFTNFCLLICIARQSNAVRFINQLHKTAAIYTEKAAPTPEIGHI